MAFGRRRHCRTKRVKEMRLKRAEEVQARRLEVSDKLQLEVIGRRRGESKKEKARLETRLLES